MTTVSIIGSGTAPKAVIQESLRDLLSDGDVVAVPWYGKPTAGLEAVYDYLLDNEVSFVMYYDSDSQIPAKVFSKAEHGSVQDIANVHTALIKASDGKILVLWDSTNDAGSEKMCESIFTVRPDALVLDLTNGLSPIHLEDEKAEAPSRYDEEDPTDDAPASPPLSRAELEGMPVPSLKRLAANTGNLPEGVTGKENYIKVILGEELPAHAFPPGKEPAKGEKPAHILDRQKAQAAKEPVTLSSGDPTQPAPTKPTIVGLDELRKSLYNQTPTAEQIQVIEAFRDKAFALGEHMVENLPVGRNRSLAMKALEDVVMRGVKGILLD